MNKLFTFFKSVKLAIVLISIIAATSILATLVPQNKDIAFYYHTYSPVFRWLIINTQFYRFFTSILFFIPAALFFINLSTCTVDRLVRELKKKGKKKFGPDILHVGLLVLLIGAVFTFAGKREGYMTLAQGDQIELPGGYVLTLKSFAFLTYENGSPKDWISKVDVEKEGKKIIDGFPIEVNKPLKVGNINIYQNSYSTQYKATFLSSDGGEYVLDPGESLRFGDGVYIYAGNEGGEGGTSVAAVFEKWVGQEQQDYLRLKSGSRLEDFTLTGVSSKEATGLQAVVDPGFIPVMAGLIILAIGLFLTYYQKLREKE